MPAIIAVPAWLGDSFINFAVVTPPKKTGGPLPARLF